MPRLSQKQREEVRDLLDNGCSLRSIATKMNTSHSTIQRLMKRYEVTGTTDDRPRSGRPRIMPVSEGSWFECVGQDRPYVCTECGKTFKKMPQLKGHLKIHGDKYDYQCDQCGRGFITSTSFTRHLRIHTGEKPYICEYCARSFADKGTMRTHIRTHTGERPHKCHLCDHACTTAGNLHAHMKVHRDKDGHIPRPANVKLPPSKTVPIFPEKDMLRKAKRKYEKYNGECWPDGDDSSEKESETTSKCNRSPQRDDKNCRNDEMDPSQSRYEVLIKKESDTDVSERVKLLVTTNSVTMGTVSPDRECIGVNSNRSQEADRDDSLGTTKSSVHDVGQETVSHVQEELLVSSGGNAARSEEEPCVQEETACIPEEEIKSEPTSCEQES